MYSNRKKEEKQRRIEAHEKKTRHVVSQLLHDMFINNQLQLEQTHTKCHVDIRITADNNTYDIEVKTRNKDVNKYPTVELKHSKLRNMQIDHINNTLMYFVIVNNSVGYFFNLSQLDWDEIDTKILHIKKVEYDDDSEYEDVPAYILPLNEAVLKVNVKPYLQHYANIKSKTFTPTISKKKAC